MMKRKGFLVTLCLTICIVAGSLASIPVFASNTEVVQPEKLQVQDYDADKFVVDQSNAPFSINNEGVCDLHEHDVEIDIQKAIENIAAGLIKSLTTRTLPEGMSNDALMDFTDVNGNIENVTLQSIATYANCAHVYTPGTFTGHAKFTDGSCSSTSYDALRCYKCNTVWLLDVIGSSTYRVCPH